MIDASPAIEGLEQERLDFCKNRYPDVKFWMVWIEDKISAVDQIEELDRLFERAISNCPHVDIVKEFVNNAFDRLEAELMNESEVRRVLERAIGVCGGDILDGAYFWYRYVDLEIDELEDLAETSASEQDQRKAKEAVISIFRRQFSLPLLGNQQSLSKLETLLSDVCVQSDEDWIKPSVLIDRYKRSEGMLASRILYEQNVTSDNLTRQPLEDRVTAWKAYIKFEMDDAQLPRAQRLYERCLLMCHESVDIWRDYLEFAENTLKQWPLVESIAQRAVRAHSGVIQFWVSHFLALETVESTTPATMRSQIGSMMKVDDGATDSGVESGDSKAVLIETVSTAVSAALCCSFPSAEDYLTILTYSCDFRRRILCHYLQGLLVEDNGNGARSASVDSIIISVLTSLASLRKAFDDAEAVMDTYYHEWGAGWLQLYKYRAAVEDEIISDVIEASEDEVNSEVFARVMQSDSALQNIELLSKAPDVWERAVNRFTKYQFIWSEYLLWARNSGDLTLARTVYQRAIRAVKDYPEEICKGYVTFEEQVGTISDLLAARNKVKGILKSTKNAGSKPAASAPKDSSGAKHQQQNQQRQQHQSKDNRQGNNRNAAVASGANGAAGGQYAAAAGKKRTHDESDRGGELAHAVGAGDRDGDGDGRSSEKSKRVRFGETQEHFVENLHYSRNSKHDVREDSDFTSAIVAATHSQVAVIAEAVVPPTASASSSSAAETASPSTSVAPQLSATTIFAKNLSFNSTVEEIREHFTPCGEIKDVRLVLSKAGKSRGQVFIEFADVSAASKAIEMNGVQLAGRPLSVEFAGNESSAHGHSNGAETQGKPSNKAAAEAEAAHHPTTVFVSKLPKELSSEELWRIFEKFGVILEARVAVDKKTGESKGHGLVQFEEEAAKKAALTMNKKELNGLVLSILPSKFPAIVETAPKAAGKDTDDDYGHYGPQNGARPDDTDTGDRGLPGRRKRGAAFEMPSGEEVNGAQLMSQSHSVGYSEGETQSKPAVVVSQLHFRPRSLPKKP